jgi:hypothetical protein
MWSQRSTVSSGAVEVPETPPFQKLAAVSLVVAPVSQPQRLADMVEARRIIAA